MKKLFEKKQWMMLSLVAALGVAVYLNYYFTQDPALSANGDPVSSSQPDDGGDRDGTLGESHFVNAGVSSDPNASGGDADEKTGYFDKARASRNAAREESLRLLQETLGKADATPAEQQAATGAATAIAENVLRESNIENLILAKGFADCVAFVEDDRCQVVVQSGDLQQQESMQILEIVIAQTAVSPQNVQIVAAKG